MKRRAFLSLLGAAGVAPALPAIGAPAPVVASYNRYMYGLAVFQARTKASVSAAELIAKLRINTAQAEAMMGEMSAKGVISPVLDAAQASARVAEPHVTQHSQLNRAAKKAAEWLKDDEPTAQVEQDLEAPEKGQEAQDGQV